MFNLFNIFKKVNVQMQSVGRELILNKNLKAILGLLIAIVIVALILFRNIFFQSTYLLKSFG